MRFLNCDKVLCLAAHPDDVEYGMLGSIIKYTMGSCYSTLDMVRGVR